MGNEYLEVGKEEGKKYQVIYIIDGNEEWNKGFDDIEIAIKIAKEALEVEKVGCTEICDVETQQDLFVYDIDTGKVRETDMRTPEKTETGRMKGNGMRRLIEEKIEELDKSLELSQITVFNGSILDDLEKLSDRIEAILQEVDISKKPKLTYELELRLDREPEFREYSSYDKARKVAITILQKGENGWYAKITGDEKVEEFVRRGPGVVYQDGKIAIEELTRDEIDQLIGMGGGENFGAMECEE